MRRIVQFTDCHLFSDPTTELRGIATWPRFLSVVEDVQRREIEFDLLVLTGDTAQDEQVATYRAVAETLSTWSDRLRIIPGNHDNREALGQIFPSACGGMAGLISFDHAWETWQVVGLDTLLTHQVSGAVSDQQLVWLHRLLLDAPELDVLLCMHHPPTSVNSPWLDRIGLEDATEFIRWLGSHRQIRLLVCGHVHQGFEASIQHATVVTTPAVGPQFRPRTTDVEIEPGPPAYRIIELLDNAQWSTQVLQAPWPTP